MKGKRLFKIHIEIRLTISRIMDRWINVVRNYVKERYVEIKCQICCAIYHLSVMCGRYMLNLFIFGLVRVKCNFRD